MSSEARDVARSQDQTQPQTRRWLTASEPETEAVGQELARCSSPDALVLLQGDLGSGKTVLVRGFAQVLGIDRREIQSPTYTLIHEHQGTRHEHHGGRLVHVDLYRLEPEDVPALGLDELLAGPGLKAIEWGERLRDLPEEVSIVRLRILADGRRQIDFDARSHPQAGNSAT